MDPPAYKLITGGTSVVADGRLALGLGTHCTAADVTVNTILPSPHVTTRKMPGCGSLRDRVQVASRPDWPRLGSRDCYNPSMEYSMARHGLPDLVPPTHQSQRWLIIKFNHKITMDTGPISSDISVPLSLPRGPRWPNPRLGRYLLVVFVVPASRSILSQPRWDSLTSNAASSLSSRV